MGRFASRGDLDYNVESRLITLALIEHIINLIHEATKGVAERNSSTAGYIERLRRLYE